jgi:hypothetical protein
MSENQPNGDGQPKQFEISNDDLDRLLEAMAGDCDEEGTLRDVLTAQNLRALKRNPGTRGDEES